MSGRPAHLPLLLLPGWIEEQIPVPVILRLHVVSGCIGVLPLIVIHHHSAPPISDLHKQQPTPQPQLQCKQVTAQPREESRAPPTSPLPHTPLVAASAWGWEVRYWPQRPSITSRATPPSSQKVCIVGILVSAVPVILYSGGAAKLGLPLVGLQVPTCHVEAQAWDLPLGMAMKASKSVLLLYINCFLQSFHQ